MVLEAGRMKSRCWQSHDPTGPSKGRTLPASFSFWWLSAFCGCISSLCLCLYMAFSSVFCVFPSLIRMSVIWFRAHPANPGRPHSNMFNSIYKDSFPQIRSYSQVWRLRYGCVVWDHHSTHYIWSYIDFFFQNSHKTLVKTYISFHFNVFFVIFFLAFRVVSNLGIQW